MPKQIATKMRKPASCGNEIPRKVNGSLRCRPKIDSDATLRRPRRKPRAGRRRGTRPSGEGHRRQRQIETLEPERGQRHEEPDRHRERRGDEQPEHAPRAAPFDRARTPAADERDLRKGDLVRPARQRDQRQHDERCQQRQGDASNVGSVHETRRRKTRQEQHHEAHQARPSDGTRSASGRSSAVLRSGRGARRAAR